MKINKAMFFMHLFYEIEKNCNLLHKQSVVFDKKQSDDGLFQKYKQPQLYIFIYIHKILMIQSWFAKISNLNKFQNKSFYVRTISLILDKYKRTNSIQNEINNKMNII